MSRFSFSVAGVADDAAIRERFAADWMPGDVSVTFRREPSFFASLDLMGEQVQVIKCDDAKDGGLVGFGSRYTRRLFYDEQETMGGYLADLRCKPAYRGRGLLARGYKYLQQLHQDSPLPVYYSMIYSGNDTAVKNLVGGRAGLPQYTYLGEFLTPAIHLDFNMAPLTLKHVTIRQARQVDLPEIIKFLRRAFASKQFAPCYDQAAFAALFRHGFRIEDLSLAVSDGVIVGTAAAFDASNFRQTHVERYSRRLSALRPLYNAASLVTPLRPLPSAGSEIPYFYLLMPAARDNDPEIMRLLLRQIYLQRRTGRWHYFIAGFHERDPLMSCLREYRLIRSSGRLYQISYDKNHDVSASASGARIPYVEPLCL